MSNEIQITRSVNCSPLLSALKDSYFEGKRYRMYKKTLKPQLIFCMQIQYEERLIKL